MVLGVSGRVTSLAFPFLHEELTASWLKLRVSAAWGWVRIALTNQVLGDNWEEVLPRRAHEKQ